MIIWIKKDVLSVCSALCLFQDTEAQVLTSDAYMIVQYNDPDLAWNPAMFGDLTTVRVPSDKIWKPDILLYNK